MTQTARTTSPVFDSTKDNADTAEILTPESVRKSVGLTRAEMATLLGMSDFGYAQWELGSRRAGGPAYRLLHLIQESGTPVIESLKRFKD